jgi:hypothetical protein
MHWCGKRFERIHESVRVESAAFNAELLAAYEKTGAS